MIDRGVILADDRLEAILGRVALRRVVLFSDDPRIDLLPGVVRAETDGDRRELFTADADALLRALVRSDLPFRGIEIRGASLEEAFGQMVADGAQGRADQSAAGTTEQGRRR